MTVLQEMFPEESNIKLNSLLESFEGRLEEVIDVVLTVQNLKTPLTNKPSETQRTSMEEAGSSHSHHSSTLSTQQVLREYSARVLDKQHVVQLEVKRERLWRTALGFYKNSARRPERLLHDFCIEFEGEEGIDAGALRNEFFENLLKYMDQEMFKGDVSRRVPKKDCSLEKNFVYAGMMIGHSILHGGPGYPCICPAVYSFLLFGDKEKALQELPSVDNVPKNASTMGLCNLITSVSLSST